MNPRESLFETFTDEFSLDQSEPLEALMSPAPANSVASSPAGVRNIKHIGPGNHLSSDPASITSAMLPSFSSPQEIDDLNKLVLRMKRMFAEYNAINGPFHFSSPNAEPPVTLLSPRSPRAEKSFTFNAAVPHSVPGPAARESGLARVAAQEAAVVCYREVPELYFRQDFSLQNADTFEKVLVPVNTARQEALSRYLDLVETALLRQIWVRSGAFFRALDDIKGLRGLVSETITHVNDLKSRIGRLDDNLAMSALRIPALERRRVNKNALQATLVSMQHVIEAKKSARLLLDVDDYVGALHVIEEARGTYVNELSRLNCLARLGQELDEYHALIGEVMSGKFVSVAIQWDDDDGVDLDSEDRISQLLEGVSQPNNGNHSASAEKRTNGRQLQLSSQLQDLLRSLLVTGRLEASLRMYERRLCDSVRLIVRTCVLEYISNFDPLVSAEIMQATQGNDNSEHDASAAVIGQRVRNMTADNFIACITMVFEHVIMALRRSQRVHLFMKSALLEETLDSLAPAGAAAGAAASEGNHNAHTPHKHADLTHNVHDRLANATLSSPISSSLASATNGTDRTALVNISKDCLIKASNLAQQSIQQLLGFRKENHMKTEHMKQFWQVSLRSIAELEELCGSSAYHLRQALNSQTKTFLSNMHSANKNNFSTVLGMEKWAPCDVVPDRQAEIDRLTSGKSFLTGLKGDATQSSSQSHAPSSSVVAPSAAGKKKEARPAIIDGAPYKVAYSGLYLVGLILSYLDVAASFTHVAPDVIEKIGDTVTYFDSKTQALVLGAGAINTSTGLKSISAKHLAVTAQTIQFLLSLLPHVRAALTALIPQASEVLLAKLDRATAALVEHHGLIVAKFVSIVGDSVDISAQKLRGVDWDRFQGQCEYFDEVSKNVAALHRVLVEVLPAELIQEIFSRIFNSLARKMPAHFDDIMPSTETGRQRILDEVTHVVSGFSRLKLVDSTGPASLLDDSFRRKYSR